VYNSNQDSLDLTRLRNEQPIVKLTYLQQFWVKKYCLKWIINWMDLPQDKAELYAEKDHYRALCIISLLSLRLKLPHNSQ
jgi:hypothetical protein